MQLFCIGICSLFSIQRFQINGEGASKGPLLSESNNKDKRNKAGEEITSFFGKKNQQKYCNFLVLFLCQEKINKFLGLKNKRFCSSII